MKNNKHLASSVEMEPTKWGRCDVDPVTQQDPKEVAPSQSEVWSSRGHSHSTRTFTSGNDWSIWTSLVRRQTQNRIYEELLLLTSTQAFMKATVLVSKFEVFAHKVFLSVFKT
jgi:hypothetical protein